MDRAEQLLDDILAAPAELAAVVAAQRSAFAALPPDVVARPRRRLMGMGSSGFAARDAAARWRLDGHDAVAETASASDGSPGGPGTLAIAVSSSGETPEVIAAARRHHADGSFVLAMTARRASTLARSADAVLPLRAARAETSGIATLTHRAAAAGLLLLDGATQGGGSGAPAGEPAVEAALDAAPAALAELLDGRGDWLAAAATAIDTGREVHVLGDGRQAGMLEQASLMLREAPRIGAVPFDTGDWLHVGLYTLLPGDAVLLVAGSPADGDAIGTIRARGAHVVVIGPAGSGADIAVPVTGGPAGSPAVWQLVVSAVPELLAAELWRRAGA